MNGAMGLFSCLTLIVTVGPCLAQEKIGLSTDLAQHRALAQAVRALRERTGWLVCVEEPIWPVVRQPSAMATIAPDGSTVQPPAADRIRVSIPSLRGKAARGAAIKQLVENYNQQNSAVAVRSTEIDGYTAIIPATVLDNTGKPTSARILLSFVPFVADAERTPTQQMEEFAKALSVVSGVPVEFDTAGFGFRFNAAYLGDPDGGQVSWGTKNTDGRTALVAFLQRSHTSTVWQVDCQVGVGSSPGRCILSVMPITVEVKDRNGNMVKRTLYYDRGAGPKVALPPPPSVR